MATAQVAPSRSDCPSITPAEYPPKPAAPPPADPTAVVNAWLSSFNSRLTSSPSLDALQSLFHEESYWRDHLCLSWDLQTLKGPSKLHSFFSNYPSGVRIRSLSIEKQALALPVDFEGTVPGVMAYLSVQTDVGSGRGMVRLVNGPSGWKAFTLFTALYELKGFEETVGARRPEGVTHGTDKHRKSWKDRRAEEVEFIGQEPTVLIVGAGQGGLATAARLKLLGVKSLIIDRNERIGDNWRKRYHQLVLHDPVFYDHMPYMKFPEFWPKFTPKDKLANWFEFYADSLELNVWMSSTVSSSSYDENKGIWSITVTRGNETRELHPKHVVVATGHSGVPKVPQFPGESDFKGDVYCHSSAFPGAKQDGKGKKAVVIGCCNSGHDVAQDLYEHDYDVTIVQRSSTCVVSSEKGTALLFKGVYEEGGMPTEDADLTLMGIPLALMKKLHIGLNKAVQEVDKELLVGLEKAGFKLDYGPQEAGLMMKYLENGGGYYIEVGCGRAIASGGIKVKQGHEVTRILENGVEFDDGSKLEADEIILATGYANMASTAGTIFGKEVEDKLGPFWGIGDDGELRGVWRRTGQKGFWMVGGNLALTRWFSKMIALQIKGLEEGLTTYDSI